MSYFTPDGQGYDDSFFNPVNAANMNPGWGIDPNLLTPSFQAAYRPSYQGNSPYRPQPMGFKQGANALFGVSQDPMWSNPVDQQQTAIDAVSGRTMDSAVWVGHRVAAPILAFAMADKMMGGSFKGALRGTGSIGAQLGGRAGGGLLGGFSRGLGLGKTISAGAAGFGTAVGGAAGLIAAPLLASQAMMYGVEKGVNGYINTRQTAADTRRSFEGVSFADASYGNVVTGGGFGRQAAAGIAKSITKMGTLDKTFGQEEFSEIASMSMRSGLLDNVNPDKISKRIKDISEQIKLIISISKDPNLKNAVEELSKLQLGGASVTGGISSVAANAYRSIGRQAGAAGQSVQSVMNGVGAQGEYLFRANGLTPYLGQLAASNTLASFATAKRMGVMSDAQLSRMGGVDGATQSSLQGSISLSQTPLNQMNLYNQYLNGNKPATDINSMMAQMSGSFAKDPVAGMGAMQLYSGAMASRQSQERGALLIDDMVEMAGKHLPLPKNNKGQYSAEQAMAIATGAFGLPPEQARAMLMERAAAQDEGSYKTRSNASKRFEAEQDRTFIQQRGLQNGLPGMNHMVDNAFRKISSRFGEIGSEFAIGEGALGDRIQTLADYMGTSNALNRGWELGNNVSVENMFGRGAPTTPDGVKYIDTSVGSMYGLKGNLGDSFDYIGRNSDSSRQLSEKINDLAKQGDASARAFLAAQDESGRGKALSEIMKTKGSNLGNLTESLQGEGFWDYVKDVNNSGRTDKTNEPAYLKETEFSRKLMEGRVDANLSQVDNLVAVGGAFDIAAKLRRGDMSEGEIESTLKGDKRYDALRRAAGDRKGKDLSEFVQKAWENASDKSQTIGISSMAFRNQDEIASYESNPNLIKDPGIRASFNRSKQSQDKQGMQDAITAYMAKMNNGTVQDATLKDGWVMDQKREDKLDFQIQKDGYNKDAEKTYKQYASGSIDYAQMVERMNQIDNKKAIDKFSNAVDKFEKSIDSRSDADSGPGWLSSINPFSSDGGSRFMNNQRKTSGH